MSERRSPERRTATGALEPVALLETNIDHLPAEELAFAAEELLGAGALDVWQTPIVMKKGRSAVMLSVLAPASEADAFAQRIIALTGSLGVRRELLERTVADQGEPHGREPVGTRRGSRSARAACARSTTTSPASRASTACRTGWSRQSSSASRARLESE